MATVKMPSGRTARDMTPEEIANIERRQQEEVTDAARQQRALATTAMASKSPVISTLTALAGLSKTPTAQSDPDKIPGTISAKAMGAHTPAELESGGSFGGKPLPIKAFHFFAPNEADEMVRYEVSAQTQEQVDQVKAQYGVVDSSPTFTDDTLALASRLWEGGKDDMSPYVMAAGNKLERLVQGIEVFNPEGGLLRQLESGFSIPGKPNAFTTAFNIGRSDRESERVAKIEAAILGARAKTVPGENGLLETFVKLTPKSPWVPIDQKGFPIGGEEGSKLAALEGDIGIMMGEHVNATNLALLASAIILPETLPVKLLGTLKPIQGANAFTRYMKTAGNQLLNKGLGKWTYTSVGTGVGTAFGNIVDNTIETFQGFQHDDWGEVLDEAMKVGITMFSIEGGMRAFATMSSWFMSWPVKRLLRVQEAHAVAMLETAHKYNLAIVPADMHPTLKAAAGQQKALSSRSAAFLRDRDVFVKAGLKDFVETTFGRGKLTQKQAAAAVAGYRTRMLQVLNDETSTIGASANLRQGLLDYAAANFKYTTDLATEALAHEGASHFSIRTLLNMQKSVEQAGTRYAKKGYSVKPGEQPVYKDHPSMPDGTMAKFSEATMRHPNDPIDSRIFDTFKFLDNINPEVRTISQAGFRAGGRSAAVDQLVLMRQKAYALADDGTLNDASRSIAVDIHKEIVRVMESPVNGTKAYKAELKKLSTYMHKSEEIETGLWAKVLTDGRGHMRLAEDYDVATTFFNLKRPELIAGVKKMMTAREGLIAPGHRWEQVREGYTAKLLNDPAGLPKALANPDHHAALKMLYSKSELKQLSHAAQMLADIQTGSLGRLMQFHQVALDPAKIIWENGKDLNSLVVLMKELGGPDSPEGRAMASSFFSMLFAKNSVKVDGMDVINNTALANAFTELRTTGWLGALVGKNQAALMDIEGIEMALGKMISGSNMGNSIIVANTASQTFGGIMKPGATAQGARKWTSNYLAGRFFVSPFMFRAAGLRDPRYIGPVAGKYLVPPGMSYLRTYVDMLAATHVQLQNDANYFNFATEYGPDDIQMSVDPSTKVKGEAPPAPGATQTPGVGALGLPNQPRAPGGLGGGQMTSSAPKSPGMPQPQRRAGGGLPTNAGAGVPPGPKPGV